MWEYQIPELAKNYRAIAPDLPGHGESSGLAQPVTLAGLGDMILALMDHLNISSAHFIGLSIGGMIALRLAITAAARVKSLTLIDTQAHAEAAINKAKYAAMAAIAKTAGIKPVVPALVPIFFAKDTPRLQPNLVRIWKKRFASVDVPSTMLILDALNRREDIRGQLGRITQPALVIHGALDHPIPVERGRELASRLPNARFEVVPHAGHLSALEEPVVVNRLIGDFLARVA